MKKYKYKTIGTSLDDSELNKLGDDGWKLINIKQDALGVVYYFIKEVN